jgi:hypothetical protein
MMDEKGQIRVIAQLVSNNDQIEATLVTIMREMKKGPEWLNILREFTEESTKEFSQVSGRLAEAVLDPTSLECKEAFGEWFKAMLLQYGLGIVFHKSFNLEDDDG